MQLFQCDLQAQLQETHRTTHTGTTIVAKHIEGTKRPQPQPPHTRGTSRYLSSPAAATLHGKTQGFVLRLPPHNTRHATFMQPFQCDLQPQLQETHRTTHTGTTIVAKHIEGTKRPQPHPPHTRGTSRYLSSPAAATLHGKTEGFVLRLPPHNTRHATFMQPFQCDLQPQLQETHRTTHTGTTIVAKHIEGTKRPQPHPPHTRGTFHRRLQPLYTEKHQGFMLRLPPHNTRHATFMQPFQCDLQPQLQAKNRTTQTGTTIVAKHIEGTKRPQPHPPHTRGTSRYLSSPAAATLHGKTQGFVLRLPPQNKAHATFMQLFQCDLQAQLQETHRTTHTGTTIVAKHIEGTKRPQPHPRHTRGTFHCRLQPLYTEKHKVSCSGFPPTRHGMQHSCSHSNAICNHSFKKRIELRTQEQPLLQNT